MTTKKVFVPELNRNALYTTDRAEGAWENGTRVMKGIEPGTGKCGHEPLAEGTVIGSQYIGPTKALFYFVEWDDRPGIPVAVQYFSKRLLLVKLLGGPQ